MEKSNNKRISALRQNGQRRKPRVGHKAKGQSGRFRLKYVGCFRFFEQPKPYVPSFKWAKAQSVATVVRPPVHPWSLRYVQPSHSDTQPFSSLEELLTLQLLESLDGVSSCAVPENQAPLVSTLNVHLDAKRLAIAKAKAKPVRSPQTWSDNSLSGRSWVEIPKATVYEAKISYESSVEKLETKVWKDSSRGTFKIVRPKSEMTELLSFFGGSLWVPYVNPPSYVPRGFADLKLPVFPRPVQYSKSGLLEKTRIIRVLEGAQISECLKQNPELNPISGTSGERETETPISIDKAVDSQPNDWKLSWSDISQHGLQNQLYPLSSFLADINHNPLAARAFNSVRDSYVITK